MLQALNNPLNEFNYTCMVIFNSSEIIKKHNIKTFAPLSKNGYRLYLHIIIEYKYKCFHSTPEMRLFQSYNNILNQVIAASRCSFIGFIYHAFDNRVSE